jgi:hypothetical protein
VARGRDKRGSHLQSVPVGQENHLWARRILAAGHENTTVKKKEKKRKEKKKKKKDEEKRKEREKGRKKSKRKGKEKRRRRGGKERKGETEEGSRGRDRGKGERAGVVGPMRTQLTRVVEKSSRRGRCTCGFVKGGRAGGFRARWDCPDDRAFFG